MKIKIDAEKNHKTSMAAMVQLQKQLPVQLLGMKRILIHLVIGTLTIQ